VLILFLQSSVLFDCLKTQEYELHFAVKYNKTKQTMSATAF